MKQGKVGILAVVIIVICVLLFLLFTGLLNEEMIKEISEKEPCIGWEENDIRCFNQSTKEKIKNWFRWG